MPTYKAISKRVRVTIITVEKM